MSDKSLNEKEAIHMFIKTGRLLRSTIENMVCKTGCHHSQHRILMHLMKHQGTPSQKEIADSLEVSPAAVAVVLRKMKKSHLIERMAADEDSRINEITITEEGRRIFSFTNILFDAADEAIFEGFSDEELLNFMKYLEHMQKNIRAFDYDKLFLKKEGD